MQYFWEFWDYLSSSCAKKWTPLAFSLFCIVLIFCVFSVLIVVYMLWSSWSYGTETSISRAWLTNLISLTYGWSLQLICSLAKQTALTNHLYWTYMSRHFSFWHFLYYLVVLLVIVWISFLFFPCTFFCRVLILVSVLSFWVLSWSKIINVISFRFMAANLMLLSF